MGNCATHPASGQCFSHVLDYSMKNTLNWRGDLDGGVWNRRSNGSLNLCREKRSFPSGGLFSFISFIFHIPLHTCVLQETGWCQPLNPPAIGREGRACDVCAEGFIYRQSRFFHILRQFHSTVQVCALLYNVHRLSLHGSPFLFLKEMNFSSLQSRSNYFGEEGGRKEGESRRDISYKKSLKKKNTLHSFTSLHKRNKEMRGGGVGGVRCYIKRVPFHQDS